jgi:hypothetical protein
MATDERPASLGCVGQIHLRDKSGQDVVRICRCRRWHRRFEVIEDDPVRKIPTSHRGPDEWTCEYAGHVVPRPSRTASDLDALPLTDPHGDKLRRFVRGAVGGGGRPDDPPGI